MADSSLVIPGLAPGTHWRIPQTSESECEIVIATRISDSAGPRALRPAARRMGPRRKAGNDKEERPPETANRLPAAHKIQPRGEV